MNGRMNQGWRNLDFRPAPAGWRAAWIDDAGTLTVEAMPGWLIQEVEWYDDDGTNAEQTQEPGDRERRVIATFASQEEVLGIDDALSENGDIWKLVAPGEPDPTEVEAHIEFARRQAEEERRAEWREAHPAPDRTVA
jgi:hypothetical protein